MNLEGFQYGGGGYTLGIFGWECAAGILEPLANTRARSKDFCYPILDLTPKIPPPPPPHPTVAVFQKLHQNRFDFFIFLTGNSRFP